MTKKRKRSTTLEEAISTLQGSRWAWLPGDILDLILARLTNIKDYIRFPLVCTHWQSIALHQNMQQRLESCHKQPPLLMLVNQHDNDTRTVALRSGTVDNQISRFRLKLNGFPIYNMTNDGGSSHGWLAYADANLVVTLLNPFTGCTITLPPIRKTNGQYYIKKVVLSADPSLCPSDFEALVMYDRCDLESLIKLAHFKSGEDAWTHIYHKEMLVSCMSTLYYRGRFLVCSNYYESFFGVFSVDVSSKRTKQLICRYPRLGCHDDSRTYLLESSEGDLMLLVRNQVESSTQEMSVKVFKLWSYFDDRLQCEQIETIGNDALFLDRNQSICVPALEFPECHPNSIYFVDGTFDLEKQKMHQRYNSILPLSAVWISPTMSFGNRLLPTTTVKGCKNN